MLDALDAGAVRSWCRSAADELRRVRADLDGLNVFPVPDRDTGTNLHLTMEAIAEAADAPAARSGAPERPDEIVGAAPDGETELARTWEAVARGALLGARGNSGVILSQVWRGLAEMLPAAAPCRGIALGDGLRHAASLAYAAVAHPVEGTLLTVIRAAGESATGHGDDLRAVAGAAAEGARRALRQTTGQLDALARSGVVDAGGAGLCVILEALVATISGGRPQRVTVPAPAAVPEGTQNAELDASSGARSRETIRGVRDQQSSTADESRVPPPGPAYEVMYLLDADADATATLRARLGELGDSLLVVGGDRLWNVHVHVDDAGAAIEAGMEAGRPHRIRVSYLRPEVPHSGAYGRGVVALATGDGAAGLFTAAGATVVRREPGSSPTLGEFLDAIRRAGDEVVVLPNDDDAREVAEAAAQRARDGGRRLSVVPARAIVQGLSALAVHDDHRRFEDDVIAMTAAAGATRFGEVRPATETAVTSAGICHAGDVLGLIEGDVAVIGADVRKVATDILDRMLSGGGELVTLVTGVHAPANLADSLVTYLHERRPDVDTGVYAGGHPDCPLLVGVE